MSQAPKPIENLEKKGRQIVKEVLDDADQSRGKERERESRPTKKEDIDGKSDAKKGGMRLSTLKVPERPSLKEMDSASSERTVVPHDEK